MSFVAALHLYRIKLGTKLLRSLLDKGVAYTGGGGGYLVTMTRVFLRATIHDKAFVPSCDTLSFCLSITEALHHNTTRICYNTSTTPFNPMRPRLKKKKNRRK